MAAIAAKYDPASYDKDEPVQVYELPDGTRVLREGNHRTHAALALALPSIRARVTKLGSAPEEKPKQATSKPVHDPLEGTHHVVTLPSGAVHKIQRMDSAGSMGLPGWHVISDPPNGKSGWEAHQPTYMGDTKQGAIQALQEREKKTPLKDRGTPGNHIVYKKDRDGARYLAPSGNWIRNAGDAKVHGFSKEAEEAALKHGARTREYRFRN